MDATEIRARLEFKRAVLPRLREAYIALVDGGVKSFRLEDRELTNLDLGALRREIEHTEREIDALNAQLRGRRARRAFGVVPRDDW